MCNASESRKKNEIYFKILKDVLERDKLKISFSKIYFLGTIADKNDNYERAKKAIYDNDISWIFSAFQPDARIDDFIDFYYIENDKDQAYIITLLSPWEFMCSDQILDIIPANPKIFENIKCTILYP